MALAEWQHAVAMLKTEQEWTALLHEEQAKAAFEAGDFEKAEAYARELLDRASPAPHQWDAIHIGNLVLGRIALRTGDIEKAKSHLIESVRTEGWPDLCSFRPRMILAKEFLERGETEVVLRYLELCSVVGIHGRVQLTRWVELIKQGEMPFPPWQL